jgi:hypothetical protein
MFLRFEDQLYNYENFQFFNFNDSILTLIFNGNVVAQIQQSENEFNHFIEVISSSKTTRIIIINNVGVNIKNLSCARAEEDSVRLYFVDGSSRLIKEITLTEFETKISENEF